MYASPEARLEGIESGLTMSARQLMSWLTAAAESLMIAMGELSPGQWSRDVVTAQGRTVPATEIPWLRAREVYIHAVDLDLGVTFADLPDDFLVALEFDVRAKRGVVPPVDGPLAERVAWLTGRPHPLLEAPVIGPWI